jgi:hypothetical protein
LLIYILKRIYYLLRYLVGLRWLLDLLSKVGNGYANMAKASKYAKYYGIIFKSSLILGLILCLIFKYMKMSKLNSLMEDELNKKGEDNVKDINKENNENEETDISNNNLNNENKVISEERWKNVFLQKKII